MVERSENGDYIFDRLPPWIPTNEGSGNFNLLDVVGRQLDESEEDLEMLSKATSVQDAVTIPQLRNLAKLVDTHPKDGETLEKYRARTIAEFQASTSEGTINDLLTNSATILGIDAEMIEYSEPAENGVAQLSFPGKALRNTSLTTGEISRLLNNHVAAGFRLESVSLGTFTYGTSDSYGDAGAGYDTLDTEGNPADSGGTYAGLI